MLEDIRGTLSTGEEYEELEDRFWSLLIASQYTRLCSFSSLNYSIGHYSTLIIVNYYIRKIIHVFPMTCHLLDLFIS